MRFFLNRILFFLVFLFFPFSFYLNAFEIEGRSRTFLTGSETKDSKNDFPLYEYLNINISNQKNISLNLGGWFKYDTADKISNKRFDSELSYSYISIISKSIDTTFILGRIPIYDSTSYELIDGFQIKKYFNNGLKISAYSGNPTESISYNKKDIIFGGKISYRYKDLYNLGASYIKENNDSIDYREEASFDLWLHPYNNIELASKSNYNLKMSGWMSHDFIVSYKSNNNFKIDFLSSWYSYDKYFTAPTSSPFFMNNNNLNPGEEILIMGFNGEFYTKNLIYALDLKKLDYKISDSSYYYGGNITYKPSNPFIFFISLHRLNGYDKKLRYYELKSFLSKEFTKKSSAFFSILDILYDEKINNIKNSYTISLSSQYKLNNNIQTSLNVEYSHNPDFNKETKMILKVIYNWGAIL